MGQNIEYSYTRPILNPKITFCKEVFKYNVKEAKAINYKFDVDKNKLTEDCVTNWIFDDYGRLKEFSFNFSTGKGDKKKYYYFKENLIKVEEYQVVTNELFYKNIYNYDKDNRYFEKIFFGKDEFIIEKEIYHYRNNEKQPYKKENAVNNEMKSLHYDSNNNLIEVVSEDTILFFEYDDRRRITKEGIVIKKPEEINDNISYFEYKYLDYKILNYYFNNNNKELSRIYYLDNKGKTIKIEHYYDAEIYNEEKLKYDSKNNLIEHSSDRKANKENSLIEYLYEYDSYDNVLIKTTKKENLIIEMEKFDYKYL